MKHINVPKILFVLWIIFLVLFLLGAIAIDGLSASLILFVAPFFFPIGLFVLLVHKIITRKDKNRHFLTTLVLYTLSTIIIFYIWIHAFDNFMSLS
jgi:hypothetical protein